MSEPLTEDDLLAILRDEEADAASYYSSELADAQAKAMDRFNARPFGDEIEGRSQVVTHDYEDTINWIMPKLMRAFMQADELISVEDPETDSDEATAGCADYLKHILFKDNDGETIIHDFAFDALLQKIGVVRVAWLDPKPKPPKTLEGVSVEVLQRYMADPEYEILEAEQLGEVDPNNPEQQPVFAIKVRQTPSMGRVCIENIPPEEYAFSRRARSAKHADYQRWKREVFLADLIREYPDKAEALEGLDGSYTNDNANDVLTDGRADARFPDEPTSTLRGKSERAGRRKVWLTEEEIRVDFDGDGITELRHVKRVGDVILENVEIERSAFHPWTPIRVAHRMVGRSIVDPIADLTRIKTVIMRNTLDSMSQSLVPRNVVNTTLMDDDTIAALLDADIGGVVPVKGSVGDAIMPLVTPDLSANGLAMLEKMDQLCEQGTGVTRHAQGLNAEAITETKGGIEALQHAANERIEMVARWLAKGITDVVESVLHLICAHQDGPRIIKINGKPMQIDPRMWSDNLTVDVSIGMATENRQTRLMNLGAIAQKQEQVIATAGPDNPICGVPEVRTTYAMLAEVMGFKNPTRFFKEIPEGYAPPPPGPDPKVAAEQAKLQLEQQKAQQNAQLEQAKAQTAAQLEREKFGFQAQMEQLKAETDKQIAMMKVESEQMIARMRIEAETAIAAQRMQSEMELARWKSTEEMKIAREGMAIKAKQNGKGNGSKPEGDGVRFGGQIG